MHGVDMLIRRCGRSARRISFAGMLLALSLLTSSAFAQQATFRFNPPNGATFVETTTMTVSREISGSGKEQVVDQSKTRITFKKTSTGYTATFTPISATRTKDGKQVSSANASDFKNSTLTYLLDKTGKVVTIKGFDAIMKDMMAKLPPKEAEEAKKVDMKAREKAMIEARKKEWDAQITKFSGKQVKTGDAWTTTDTLPLPGKQTATAKKVLKFFFPFKVNGRDCVKIVSSFIPDVAAMKAAMNRNFAETSGTKGSATRVVGLTMTMSGERVIDPTTMLVYSEKIESTTKIVIDIPKKGQQTMTTIEKKEQTIDYKG